MKIVVLSTFDVWPPRDGGQNRYVNMWRNFSKEHDITIVAYEIRNAVSERRYRLAENLEVVVPPAYDGDVRHFHHLMSRTGLWLQDVLCISDYSFTSAFINRLRDLVADCDVVVASHPYLAPIAFPLAARRAVKVYESYNVEYDIKKDYFESGQDELLQSLLKQVAAAEWYASRQANLVTAVSRYDQERLAELYSIPEKKIVTVPNGANIKDCVLFSPEQRQDVRAALGLADGTVGIFVGSAYAANVESYRQAREMLQAAQFKGTMLLVGSIDRADRSSWPKVGFDERWMGFVDVDVRDLLLGFSDFALHLMFAGAGTNLKLFDYMGAGVPIISNKFGRRGVDADGWSFEVESREELQEALTVLSEYGQGKASKARQIALDHFDWTSIAQKFERQIIDLTSAGSNALNREV